MLPKVSVVTTTLNSAFAALSEKFKYILSINKKKNGVEYTKVCTLLF
jgi:hypothetical protein